MDSENQKRTGVEPSGREREMRCVEGQNRVLQAESVTHCWLCGKEAARRVEWRRQSRCSGQREQTCRCHGEEVSLSWLGWVVLCDCRRKTMGLVRGKKDKHTGNIQSRPSLLDQRVLTSHPTSHEAQHSPEVGPTFSDHCILLLVKACGPEQSTAHWSSLRQTQDAGGSHRETSTCTVSPFGFRCNETALAEDL